MKKNPNKTSGTNATSTIQNAFSTTSITNKNKNKNITKIKFADLFSWIWWFNLAMSDFNWECIFSSEIDKNACKVYQNNFWHYPNWDITKIKSEDIPNFDIMLSWNPCQSFSIWWNRGWMNDLRWNLFYHAIRVLKDKQPKYALFENVNWLLSSNDGKDYLDILKRINDAWYYYPETPIKLSPHEFWIPVLRRRIFIPCIRKDLLKTEDDYNNFQNEFNNLLKISKTKRKNPNNIYDLIWLKDTVTDDKYRISNYQNRVLEMWEDFYQWLRKYNDLPSQFDFNIMFWRNKYMWEIIMWTPKERNLSENVYFSVRHNTFIKRWAKRYDNLSWVKDTHKKFEMQYREWKSIFNGLIQFRASWIRVKKPTEFSTLTTSWEPQIIGKFKRKLTPNEYLKLQSFPENFRLLDNNNQSYKQLWNSVNIEVVKKVLDILLKF